MFFVLSIFPLLSLIRRGSTIAISKNPKHLQADTLKQFNLKFSFTLLNLQFISDFNGIPSNLCSTPLIVPRLISRVFFVLSSSGLRKVQIAYPLVVAVLPDVPEEHGRMLGAQGCIVHEIKSIYPPRTRPSSLWPTTSSTTLSFASRR
ncbi:Galactinol synthase 6 [Camellia lanceoleosa]|uniref:Galactinol synthase 6 n=1 Tax=Camellia lanceoleosa TaxID=1840588 RepID=A0ACC0GHG1_9ERIC|nr:Galactinol synthase 6 [Camellia lanceoleosa]